MLAHNHCWFINYPDLLYFSFVFGFKLYLDLVFILASLVWPLFIFLHDPVDNKVFWLLL